MITSEEGQVIVDIINKAIERADTMSSFKKASLRTAQGNLIIVSFGGYELYNQQFEEETNIRHGAGRNQNEAADVLHIVADNLFSFADDLRRIADEYSKDLDAIFIGKEGDGQ